MNVSSINPITRTRLALLLACASTGAIAHPGHVGQADGISNFLEGALHPLTGVDHLLAMLAVGIWSALAYPSLRRAIYLPLSFSLILLLGALLGVAGLHVPMIEPVIMVSLLVLGLLLATRATLPVATGSTAVAFFAFFHGAAHGTELPDAGYAFAFILGFMLTTGLVHCIGMTAGSILSQRQTWLARLTGFGIASYGAALLLATR